MWIQEIQSETSTHRSERQEIKNEKKPTKSSRLSLMP